MIQLQEINWTPIHHICCCGTVVTTPLKEGDWICNKCHAKWSITEKDKLLKQRGDISCFLCYHQEFRFYKILPENQIAYIYNACRHSRAIGGLM